MTRLDSAWISLNLYSSLSFRWNSIRALVFSSASFKVNIFIPRSKRSYSSIFSLINGSTMRATVEGDWPRKLAKVAWLKTRCMPELSRKYSSNFTCAFDWKMSLSFDRGESPTCVRSVSRYFRFVMPEPRLMAFFRLLLRSRVWSVRLFVGRGGP